MNCEIRRVTGCLLIFLALQTLLSPGLAVAAAGRKPVISEVTLRAGQQDVLLSAKLDAPISEKVREAVMGGVPLTFRYKIRLTKKGAPLGERILRTEDVVHTIQYNPVKKIFDFKTEGYRDDLQKTTKDANEAFRWMSRVEEWHLYPLKKLRSHVRYRVRVMATLNSVELPSVLGYLFFFTSIFNSDTPWKQVEFSY
ncbi:hypothetical protein BMS3Abin14_01220 [bacterium BMS3Abin14]|nr:hypothetical protein BMS3Abin14_01220 [bacterium BMS3Abin14]